MYTTNDGHALGDSGLHGVRYFSEVGLLLFQMTCNMIFLYVILSTFSSPSVVFSLFSLHIQCKINYMNKIHIIIKLVKE